MNKVVDNTQWDSKVNGWSIKEEKKKEDKEKVQA